MGGYHPNAYSFLQGGGGVSELILQGGGGGQKTKMAYFGFVSFFFNEIYDYHDILACNRNHLSPGHTI